MEDVTPQIQIPDSENADFICPKDGKISQNDVVFLCNKCKQADLVLKGGIYMCPTCFFPGEKQVGHMYIPPLRTRSACLHLLQRKTTSFCEILPSFGHIKSAFSLSGI